MLSFTLMPRFSTQQKEQLITALLLMMLTSLFISRAALSVSMGLFVIVGCWLNPPDRKAFHWRRQPVAVACIILFAVAFISGLCSSDVAEWWNRCQVKLPLLLLPPVFIGLRLNGFSIFTVHLLFIFCVLGGTVYSMYEYVSAPEFFEAGYHRAKVLPVLLDGDHIRFSWLVVLAIILLLYIQKDIVRRSFKIISWVLAAWLIIYLHILSAKTGLLMLYGSAIWWLGHQIFMLRKKWAAILLSGVLLLPVLAYFTVPTFQKRVDYMRYDFSFYSTGQYRAGMSDAARVQSLQAGVGVWRQAPLAGVGMGDVETETFKWYEKHLPALQEYEKILPSSQLLLYAAGSGIIGLVIVLLALALPLTQRYLRRDIFFMPVWLSGGLSFLFEIHLEGQYGAFIFCFFACWFHLLAGQLKKTP
jgi:O-antigen ligase